MKKKSNIFLIPNTLGDVEVEKSLPQGIGEEIKDCRLFFVEHPKAARKLLIGLGLKQILDDTELISMKNRLDPEIRDLIKEKIKNGDDIGIVSDAGCPAIADPGYEIVQMGHVLKANIKPFIGPSSILLALMASGFNGQNFTFLGYLPKDQVKRKKRIQDVERNAHRFNQTQIFIETPYRNKHLFNDLLSTCQKNTKICVAVNLTLPDQWIRTYSVSDWKKNMPVLAKNQCIFLLYK